MGSVLAGKALDAKGSGPFRPYLRTKNVLDGRIDLDGVLWMPMTETEFDRFHIVCGDVLLNEGQSLELVGRCSIYRDEFRAPIAMQNQLLRFRAHAGTSPEFAAHLFRFCQQTGTFATIATQTTSVAHLGSSRFSNLALPWPTDRREQQAVAEALSNIDDLIAALERLIAKKQTIKQGMMQQLLTGRTRLPGFTAPWSEIRLGSVGKCMRGVGYDPSADLSSGDRPFTARLLRSNNIQNGRIDPTSLQFVHERRVSDAQILKPGDIVICMANGSRALLGKAAIFEEPNDGLRYTFGAFMGAFRTHSSAGVPRFVAEMMRTQKFRNWLDLILSGSSINNLRPGAVEGFSALMPGQAEQLAIAGVLSNADAEIDLLRERLAKTRAVKAGMMQQLLTGRTRLPVGATS
jgi:type I restriction enzyme S subunit